MTELLCRLFIKNREDVKQPQVRRAYGTLVSIVGVLLNVLLCVGKLIVGGLSGSLAIQADAVNNLSDAGSQLISLVTFKISAKPADRDHPFGHARIEYVASMIVSMLILLIGYELLRDSIDKIIHPVKTEFHIASVVVLAVSILVKLWLGLFNRKIGRRIDSDVMRATMTDSLSDAAATGAVLLSMLIFRFTGFDADAYMGVLVAVLILVAGIKILNEAKNSILGEAPKEEIVEQIRTLVREYPDALGIHDLVVHNYGPGQVLASLHVEVDGAKDVYETHDMIDCLEKRLLNEAGIQASIHMDPIVTDDVQLTDLRLRVREALQGIDPRLDMHDFRMVRGVTHSNLIFDVVAPFELAWSDEALCEAVDAAVKQLDESYFTVITVDRA